MNADIRQATSFCPDCDKEQYIVATDDKNILECVGCGKLFALVDDRLKEILP